MCVEVKKRTSGAGVRLLIAFHEAGSEGIDKILLAQKVYGSSEYIFQHRAYKLLSMIKHRYGINVYYDRSKKRYFWLTS